MKLYEKVWQYECPNTECALVAHVNNVVLGRRYSDGVPCPRCGQEMTRAREALDGEFNPTEQEVLAGQELDVTFQVVPPWKAFGHEEQGSPSQADHLGERNEKDVLTEEDAARILHIEVKDVHRLVKQKRLGCIRLKQGKIAFTHALIDTFVQRESGIIPVHQEPQRKGASVFVEQPRKSISVEESRRLLKDLEKKS